MEILLEFIGECLGFMAFDPLESVLDSRKKLTSGQLFLLVFSLFFSLLIVLLNGFVMGFFLLLFFKEGQMKDGLIGAILLVVFVFIAQRLFRNSLYLYRIVAKK